MKRQTLNISQTVEYLGCSRSYVYRLYAEGRIEGYRIGDQKGLRFYLDSLNDYIFARNGE